MTQVSDQFIECPVCGANTAHTDLDIHTNERTWNCERCGFYSETKIVERAGRKFWEHAMQMPMSEAVVRRRFGRSIRNFFSYYHRLADSWSLFDNSGATPILIAFEKQGKAHIMGREIYNELVARYGKT